LARAEEGREPLGIRYARTSYTDLGMFPDGSFDAVVSFMAMMDGPRFDPAMRGCFRVLPSGGGVAVSHTHPRLPPRGPHSIRHARGVKVNRVVGHYFDPAGWVERWRFTDAPPDAPEFSVPCFGRTLSDYVNTVIDAGFLLSRIEEPRASEEFCRDHPGQR